jgi:choline dehydrogenase
MGKASDKNAVVDSNANVIGVNALRVVDASAFPFLPPGHPMATVCKSQERTTTFGQIANGTRRFG